MQRESWKVFLACAIGAGLGSLVALEMNHFFWWIGLIVGGLTGYLSYEWRAVLRAIPAAYHAARGYRFPEDFRPMFFWSAVVTGSIATDICLGLASVFLVLGFVDGIALFFTTSFWYGFVSMAIIIPLFALLFGFILACHQENRDGAAWKNVAGARRVLRIAFPPILFGWYLPRLVLHLVIGLAEALYTVFMALPRLARFFRRFGWQLFLRIHSEMRLLCGMDAMLGAAVGYFAGSALVGTVAGGLFGILNYAVVTERWLKRHGYLPIRS